MQPRYSHARRTHTPPRRSSLPLRLGLSLALAALALAIHRWQPELLEPLCAQLLGSTGEVAEAFARFSSAVGSGEPVAEAWGELRAGLAEELADRPPDSSQPRP